MPYSLELIAQGGPLPGGANVEEWLRAAAPRPLRGPITLSRGETGDRIELQLPFRIDEEEASSLVAAALRTAAELRLVLHDPQLGRPVVEADLDAVVEHWRALGRIFDAKTVIPDAARGSSFAVIAVLVILGLLALLAVTLVGGVGAFATMVDGEARSNAPERSRAPR